MKFNIFAFFISLLLLSLPHLATAQKSKKSSVSPIVTPLSQPHTPTAALQGRHIALWNSHGQYYNQIEGKWRWQRAVLMGTVEDLHTTDYVLSYLVPMLENAGANVFLPRERDINRIELIIDNDGSTPPFASYSETGNWERGKGKGFAHLHDSYTDGMNPFEDGSYRFTKSSTKQATASVTWSIPIEQSGEYAVYIAYRSVKSSTTDARYTVYHAGGESQFAVNQSMGGSTWIYLGTFYFTPESDNRVVLDNLSAQKGSIITADAVKVGGGMGNVARMPCLHPRKATKEALNNQKKEARQKKKKRRKKKTQQPKKATHITVAETSGMPRYTEAARYWMQWAGVPDTIYSDTGGDNDYYDDLRGRGYWVNYLCGGSKVLPDSVGLNIPLDLALAFHSDAGNEAGDSIVGTMSIYYTGKKKRERRYANGASRTKSQKLSDAILGKIKQEIQGAIYPRWTIRPDRNKRYAEARIGEVPTLLLETMSHQNFTDMRYGLDPRFKFIYSRAVYKGILQYLSQQNKTDYVVQPLPVNHMALHWKGIDQIELTWQAVTDTLEATAKPTHYIVYTREGDQGWDNGTLTESPRYSQAITPDTHYSFYVTAVNRGGESFPSEILSACKVSGAAETVMIVNAFDRISAPRACDDTTRTFSGFRYDIDGGVPYRHTVAYTGEQQEFNRLIEWVSDDNPGFGASKSDFAGKVIAGNTFNYPLLHGRSIVKMGHSYLSASDEAVTAHSIDLQNYPYVDIILGKERATPLGNDSTHYDFQGFTPQMIDIITQYCHTGGRLLVSGAYVGQDLFDGVMASDSGKQFATDVLHFRWEKARTAHDQASVHSIGSIYKHPAYLWESRPNEDCYAVEQTDVLQPTGAAVTFMQYSDYSGAAIAFNNNIYRCCTLGFPIEAIKTASQRDEIMEIIFQFLNHKH